MRWAALLLCLGFMGCVNPWVVRINELDADHVAGKISDQDYAAKRTWMVQQYIYSEIRTEERNQVFAEFSGPSRYTAVPLYTQRQTAAPRVAAVGRAPYRQPPIAGGVRAVAPRRERFGETRERLPRVQPPRLRAPEAHPFTIPPVPLQPPPQRNAPPPKPVRNPSTLIVDASI